MTQPQRPDKKAVLGETFTDEKLKLFFQCEPYDSPTETDFHILLKAYRGLPADAFEHFLTLFVEAGKNLQAKNAEGKTLLQVIKTHDRQPIYVQSLEAAGG